MIHVPIVGITGKKFSGKSRFASELKETLKNKYDVFGARYAFAQPLKEVCHKLFGGSEANWYGDFKNQRMDKWADLLGEKFSTPRRIMQSMGTEIFRNHIHKDIWLHFAESMVNEVIRHESPDYILIDDVRFDNEAHWILSQHFEGKHAGDLNTNTVISVTRTDLVDTGDKHVSEQGVLPGLITDYICNHDVDAVTANAEVIAAKLVSQWKRFGIIA